MSVCVLPSPLAHQALAPVSSPPAWEEEEADIHAVPTECQEVFM
jgi:hypothetical protein